MFSSLKTVCCVVMVSLVCLYPQGARCETVDLENDMKAFVLQVIRDHPEVIYEVLNTYVREKSRKQQANELESGFENRVQDDVLPNNPVRGPENAPITLIAYTDFQCPYCARAAKTLESVLKKYPNRVRMVFKNLTLKFHKEAVPAAKAALAAHKQGRFWDYHDRLFANSKKLNEELYVKIATELGLNMTRFEADRNSREIAEQVKDEAAQAGKLKISATPTFIINGVFVRGARPLAYFSTVIDRLLAEQDPGAAAETQKGDGEAAKESVDLTPK